MISSTPQVSDPRFDENDFFNQYTIASNYPPDLEDHQEPFAFTKHILNQRPMLPIRPPSSGFNSPSTQALSSPIAFSSPSSLSFDEGPSYPFYLSPVPQLAAPQLPPQQYQQQQHQASSSTGGGRRAKRPRPSSHEDEEVDTANVMRRLPGACTHCKKLKMKCEFVPLDAPTCRRCANNNHECIVEGRKKPDGPNVRERLLRDIRARDSVIGALLAQIYHPSHGTPLQLAANKIDPASLSRRLTSPPSPPESDSEQPASASAVLASLAHPPRQSRAWEAPLLEDSEDDSDSTGGDSEAGQLHALSLPDDSAPLGIIARMSLQDAAPTALERAAEAIRGGADAAAVLGMGSDEELQVKKEEGDVGIESPRFFHPGPAANPGLRRIIIERQMPPEILEYGLVTPDEVDTLFKMFFQYINPSLSILDPVLHTPSATYRRDPFLFTVVCATALRFYTARPDAYGLAMHFAKKAAASVLIGGWKSIEMVQAFIILADYAPSARRWEEDRSYLYKGLAIRLATDLNLHHLQPDPGPGASERAIREARNRTRVWLICFNIDRSGAAQFGKPACAPDLPPHALQWWRAPHAHPYDLHLCAYSALLRLVGGFHALVRAPNADYEALVRLYDAQVDAFREEWEARYLEAPESDDPGVAYRISLTPCTVNYCKLVMASFGFQDAYKRGKARGSPFFLRCWNAASAVVRGMTDLGRAGHLRHAPECHFIFGAFAAAFLIKLLRVGSVDVEQRSRALDLVERMAQAFEDSAVDEQHAPRLYGRFLSGLVQRQEGGSKPATPTPPPAPPAAQPRHNKSKRALPKIESPPPPPQPQQQQLQQQQQQQFDALSGYNQYQFDFTPPPPAGQDVEMDFAPVPMRALVQPAWNEHMLLPGFYQPEEAATGELRAMLGIAPPPTVNYAPQGQGQWW